MEEEDGRGVEGECEEYRGMGQKRQLAWEGGGERKGREGLGNVE